MKNIAKIKQLNTDELATLINSANCDYCIYLNGACGSCQEGVKQWLEQESEVRDERN